MSNKGRLAKSATERRLLQPSEGESRSVVFNSATLWTISVYGILQARILEWVAFPFPRGFSNPGIKPRPPILQVDSLPAEPQGKSKNTGVGSLSFLQWIFSTQKLNWGLLHCMQILYQLSYERSPPQPSTREVIWAEP